MPRYFQIHSVTADLPRLQYSVNDFGPAAVSLQGAVLFFQAGTLWILVLLHINSANLP